MVNAKIWMQFMTVASLHQSHKKSTLGWQKKKWRKSVITIKSHSTTNDIYMRRHFEIMCGIWRKPYMYLLTWNGQLWGAQLTQTSQKSGSCLCMKNWLSLPIQDNANFQINDRSYFANAVVRISTYWKTLELMTKSN